MTTGKFVLAEGSREARRKGISCPNPQCYLSGLLQKGNIVRASNYGKNKDKKRWKCKVCGKTFCETKFTDRYRAKKDKELYLKVLSFRKDFSLPKQERSIRQIAKKFNLNRNTVWKWLVREHISDWRDAEYWLS